MKRTADRPLPAGRSALAAKSLSFAATTLARRHRLSRSCVVNRHAAGWALATWLLYVVRVHAAQARSAVNTAVGAVAGALPVLMGWAAVGGALRPSGAGALFLIVFLWQFPHFMAIAWLYREEYARGRLQMLTVVDPTGRRGGRAGRARRWR